MVILREGDVRPGKCFSTQDDDKVRRVLSLKGGVVEYEVRSRRKKRPEWGARSQLPVAEFLSEAVREVGSDY